MQYWEKTTNIPKLVICDDNLDEIEDNILKLLYISGRHLNIGILILTQQIFQSNRHAFQVASLNAKVIILFNFPRNMSKISILIRQIFPTKWREVIKLFEKITAQPFKYLLINLSPNPPPLNMRILTNFLPDEAPMKAYSF